MLYQVHDDQARCCDSLIIPRITSADQSRLSWPRLMWRLMKIIRLPSCLHLPWTRNCLCGRAIPVRIPGCLHGISNLQRKSAPYQQTQWPSCILYKTGEAVMCGPLDSDRKLPVHSSAIMKVTWRTLLLTRKPAVCPPGNASLVVCGIRIPCRDVACCWRPTGSRTRSAVSVATASQRRRWTTPQLTVRRLVVAAAHCQPSISATAACRVPAPVRAVLRQGFGFLRDHF